MKHRISNFCLKQKNKYYNTRYMTDVRRYIKDFCGLKK